MIRTGLPPNPEATREAMAQLAEMEALSHGMDTATKRGGHAPEIRAMMSAATDDHGGVPIHGFTLLPPAFGTLQILDEIESPLLVGGAVKLGQIAAGICVLEAPEKCWKILSGTDGLNAFNAHVWERTKRLTPPAATEIAQVMIRLIREACGLAGAEEAAPGNPPAGPTATAAGEQARTPAGSPPSLSASAPTTGWPFPTPSGASQPAPPASSSTPAPNAPAAPLPALAPLTAPVSPPSAPPVPGLPASPNAPIYYNGQVFGSKEELTDFLYNRPVNSD